MSLVWLQNLAIAWIAIWSISPVLFANGPARLVVILATMIWLALEIGRRDGLAKKVTLPVLLTLLFVFYTGLIELFLSGVSGLIDHIQLWIMLFFLVVWQSRRNNPQSLVPVFWIVATVYPVWLFITIQTILTVNSHAARLLVRSSEEALELAQQGVGGYGLVYGSLLFIPALVGLASNPSVLRGTAVSGPLRLAPRLAYLLVLVNIVLGVILVVTAGFSIAVIALFAIIVLVIFLKSFNGVRLFFAIFVTVIVSAAAEPLLEAALSALLPLAEGTNFANKIRDVLASLAYGEATGSAADRVERYSRSLLLFAESPLIGVLANDDVGKHSEILDNYARWGAVFGSIFVYLVTFQSLRIMRENRHHFGVGLAMLTAVAVIFGLNNSFAAAGLMLYIMFPVSLHILTGHQTRQSPIAAKAAHA